MAPFCFPKPWFCPSCHLNELSRGPPGPTYPAANPSAPAETRSMAGDAHPPPCLLSGALALLLERTHNPSPCPKRGLARGPRNALRPFPLLAPAGQIQQTLAGWRVKPEASTQGLIVFPPQVNHDSVSWAGGGGVLGWPEHSKHQIFVE